MKALTLSRCFYLVILLFYMIFPLPPVSLKVKVKVYREVSVNHTSRVSLTHCGEYPLFGLCLRPFSES